MKKFRFVGINSLEDTQVDQVAKLLFETGYYEYVSLNNKLNLSTLSFQKEQTLKPYAKYTYVLVDVNNNVVGFFIAVTKQQMLEIKKTAANWYREAFDVKKFSEQLSYFYTHETLETDFILYGIAISSLWRGTGLFKILYNEILRLARNNHCSRVIFTVWSSNLSVNIYKYYDAKIIGELDFTNMWFNDKLIKCCFEL